MYSKIPFYVFKDDVVYNKQNNSKSSNFDYDFVIRALFLYFETHPTEKCKKHKFDYFTSHFDRSMSSKMMLFTMN